MDDRRQMIKRRIGRFIGIVASVAVITGMVIINQRLSRDTLALLVGLIFGIGAMLPTIGLGVYILRREDMRRKEREQRSVMRGGQPPVIVVAPQQFPGQNQGYGYGYQNPYQQQPPILVDEQGSQGWGLSRSSGRDFQMVGGED